MSRLMSWLATWLGLKAASQKILEDSLRADLVIAGTVMEAQRFHEAEQYCRELESQGQKALAAEIRRRLQAISAPAAIPVCGGNADCPVALPGSTLPALPAPTPSEVPGAAPLALPAPQPQKRKPGRPRKNPVELPALPAPPELKPNQNNPCDPRLY